MKSTQKKLFTNLLVLVLCVAMLTGTTFAWFTDSVTSTGNIVKAGNLKIDMLWTDDLDNGQWHSVEEDGYNTLFNNETNWEPGYTEVRYIKIKNTGDLAFNFDITLEKEGTAEAKLAEVIQVYATENVNGNITDRTNLGQSGFGSVGMLDAMMNGGRVIKGTLLPATQQSTEHKSGETVIAIALQMITTAGNEYQGADLGEGFKIKALATQCTYESDSFDKNYDNGATPGATITATSVTAPVASNNGVVASKVTMSGNGIIATVPAGAALADNVSELKLTVNPLHTSESGITAVNDEMLIPVDIHIDGLAENNNVPVIIELGEILPKYLNMGNYKLFHIEDSVRTEMTYVADAAALNTHNQFTYDAETGAVTVAMATFSEVALFADTVNAWEGEFDYTWYDADAKELTIYNADQLAAFGAIVGGMNGQKQDDFSGKTVKLIADVNLGYGVVDAPSIFYPIGYYNSNKNYEKVSGGSVTSSVSSFEGTFDGNGHTISNFYQNTWEMFGDYNDGYSGTPNHYKDAMGLFGYVKGGTVKNLTVDNFSSDGEFTPTGVIAAYADGDAKFENIAITNCNPRVYNTGNGGIIGIAGDTSAANDDHITLKNITVDNSNKISALWGSWDVACGGLVGMYRGNVDGSGNATGDTISFENCHVSAIIDVYNDVCANYQYYAYRYSGMIIGSVRHNTTNKDGKTIPNMTGISATGCTVNYGDWDDYYYCEFEKNTMASYSEDYQFSRVPHSELNFTDSNGNGVVDADERASVIGCKHTHTAEENHQAIYLPFHQLFTGYSWGVSSIGLEKYSGIVTNLDITEGDQEESVEKFVAINAETVEYGNGYCVTIGELFGEYTDLNDKYPIIKDKVQVFVSPASERSTAGGIYTPNADDWTKGTLTFTGLGEATISITDYNFCKTATANVKVTKIEKFKCTFDNKIEELGVQTDFLYRVGNQNAVAIGSLFGSKDDSIIIDNDAVKVTVETINGNATGEFTEKSDWANGEIKFSGTGVVKVKITENEYCIPTELMLEVVDATNVAENGKIGNYNTTSVLLGNTAVSTLYLNGGATLYGNGFTVDCTNSPINGSGSVSENYIIGLVDAHLDNVKVVGKVYTEYGAQASNDYNRALVLSKGNSTITNCYLSNTASPIRLVEGSLVVKGTTVKGGNFANIDVRNGHLTVEDVTTINQALGNDTAADGTTVIGLGIVVFYENVDPALTSITINGTLKQYNNISSNDKFTHDYATQFVNQMMTGDYAEYRREIDGVKWVNTGIIALTDEIVPVDKRDDIAGYVGKAVSFMSQDGYVYSVKPTNDSIVANPDTYTTIGQGVIAPSYNFDYITKNYVAKTDGSNDYCYYENGKVLIAMDQGDTFEWDPFILTATKNGESLGYTVSMNGTTYASGSKIAFSTSDDYEVIYTYTDENNYTVDANDNIKTVPVTYTKTVNISVSVIKPTTQHATFTFADTNTETEKVTVGDKTYISAKGVSATEKDWGYITVNGTTIFYPITEAQMKKNLIGTEVQVYYYVFKDAVTVNDYADGGTGAAITYNSSTTTMPSNLTVVNGMEAKYSDINSACVDVSKLTKDGPTGEVWDFSASTTVSGTTTYSGYLAHSSPSGLAIKSGTRDYDAITVAQFSYTDAAGATYYYFVGYFMPNQVSSSSSGGTSPCVTPDTLVTLADGSQKRIDEVTYEDQLLVWDFYNGEYASAPSAIIFDHGYDNNTVIKLKFDDGTEVKVVNLHQFMDADLNKLVSINEESVADFVGHKFVKCNGNGYSTVTLVDYEVTKEYEQALGIISAEHYNIIVGDMLSADFMIEDYDLFNYFEIGEDMKFDAAKMQADIEKYGLYTYEDFAEYLTPEQFAAFNVPYFKVAVGKGNYTYEGILDLIDEYLNK